METKDTPVRLETPIAPKKPNTFFSRLSTKYPNIDLAKKLLIIQATLSLILSAIILIIPDGSKLSIWLVVMAILNVINFLLINIKLYRPAFVLAVFVGVINLPIWLLGLLSLLAAVKIWKASS